jgi:hypothetical protein
LGEAGDIAYPGDEVLSIIVYIEGAMKDLSFARRKMVFVSGPYQCGKAKPAKILLEDWVSNTYYSWDA